MQIISYLSYMDKREICMQSILQLATKIKQIFAFIEWLVENFIKFLQHFIQCDAPTFINSHEGQYTIDY